MSKKDSDKEIENELRSKRKFSMMDAIARDTKGMFKDISVVPALTQATTYINMYIRSNVRDTSGALVRVLEIRVKGSDTIVGAHTDSPLEALKIIVSKILSSNSLLYDFVRQVDQMYGRIYLERPHFQKPGQEPHPDDEYTHDSVKKDLEELLSKIT